jgi:nitric oxide synthase oxygenase domain/subunit
MKRLFGTLMGGLSANAGQRVVHMHNQQGQLITPPATITTPVFYDTDHDDGLTWTITLVIADFHLQIGGIYYCGSTFTGTRGQCVGIGQAQGDVSTLAVA